MIYKTLLVSAFYTLPMLATTYYVGVTGSDLNPGTSQSAPWRTVNRVENATLHSGDQVLFQRGGTWRELLYLTASGVTYGAWGTGARPIITGANTITSGWVSRGSSVWAVPLSVAPSLVWFNGIRGVNVPSVSAVAGLNEWTYSGGSLYVYSRATPTNVEASQRGVALAADGFGNETFSSIDFRRGNSLTVYIGSSMTGIQTFQDVIWEDSPAEGIMVLSGALHISSSIGRNNFYGVGAYGGTGVTFNNSIISGSTDSALVIAGTSGPSSITSSTITGNATNSNVTYVIANWSGQPLTASNSILLPNPYLPAVWNFAGLTDDGSNVYQSPLFTQRAAPLIVVPYIDDYINLSVAQAVTQAAQSYGFNISYALNTRLVTSQDWATIAALKSSGTDIVAHTRTHSDLASLDVLAVQYTGPATSATMTINVGSGKLQTFLNGSLTPDLNLSIPQYFAATDLCSFLSSQPGYSCSIPEVQQSWFNPVNFADVTTVNIKAPYTIQADPSRFYSYEIQGSMSDIQTNIGYAAPTFATPYSSSSDAVDSLIQSAGLQMNRNGMPDILPITSVLMSNLNVFNVASQWALEFDFSNPNRSIGALVEALGARGGVFAFYSHGYDEFTLGEWTTFFAGLKAIGATVMTASQASSYIRSHGTLVQDGTNKFWNVPIQLSPNYTPTPSSPTQGAHLTQ